MIPVDGTHRAFIPLTCGSVSLICSGPISLMPWIPFAVPRRRSSSRRGISSALVATTIFPQISKSIPCSSAKATIDRAPSVQVSAFSEPGR